jgi:hypothetical protein
MTETSSTPPNKGGDADSPSRASHAVPQTKPSACALPGVAPQARRGERVIVPQTPEPAADRTEHYLRGPTAYCA